MILNRIRYENLIVISRKYSNLLSRSSVLNSTMKNLMNSEKYREILDLFDQQSSSRTDTTFYFALKAATKLMNYDHGIRIYHQLSSKSLANPYIQTSLIHFFSN